MNENFIRIFNSIKTFILNYGNEAFLKLEIVTGLLILFILFFAITLRRHKKLRKILQMNQRLLQLDPVVKLETNLMAILEMISEYVAVENYSFYVYESNNQSYVLKAIRHQSDEFGKVGPSYSGLTEYKKESYHPPLILPQVGVSQKIQVEKEGEVPILTIPLPNKKGVIVVGPIKGLSLSTLKSLKIFSEQVGYVLHSLLTNHESQSKTKTALASIKAVNHIGSITLDNRQVLDTVLEAILETFQASGVLFIYGTREGFKSRLAEEKTSVLTYEMVVNSASLAESMEIFSATNPVILKPLDPEFSKLPPNFASTAQTVLAIRSSKSKVMALFIRFDENRPPVEIPTGQLDTLIDNLELLLMSHDNRQQLINISTEFLKSLVRMMDSTNPYTLGYSELMSRYSTVLALRLGMPDDEIRDVGLAAFLSNIGVLGLSRTLYLKEGKYTENEFARMKLHSEVGATIVRLVTGNERAASFILHHHERCDGNGYPFGLQGEEIPLGARILAVVQTFLAKINGRRYRHPLPFDQALHLLQTASGSQLDEKVVNALIQWFEEKQTDPSKAGRSLGTCWEICCSPASLCIKCPAYQKEEKNCWEFTQTLCHLHGKYCESCIVKTEWLTRLRRPN